MSRIKIRSIITMNLLLSFLISTQIVFGLTTDTLKSNDLIGTGQSSSSLSSSSSPVHSSSSSSPSSSASSSSSALTNPSNGLSSSYNNYYINDLSSFLSSLPSSSSSSLRPDPSGPMLKYAQAFGTDSSFQSYQALLKALAQSSASGSSSSPISIQQSQSMLSNSNPPISNKLFSSFFPSSASSSSSSASPQFSSNAWMTLPTSWAPSSLISILKPSHTPLGSRRSSFSNRLRNIMNALFYRRETSSPMMTSGSSYSYSYRPMPYGFTPSSSNELNSFNPFSSYSSLYGNNQPYSSSFYPGGSSSSITTDRFPSQSSLYGAASNYRPSFVALPSVPSSLLNNGISPPTSWSASAETNKPNQMMYNKNYDYGTNHGSESAYLQGYDNNRPMQQHSQHSNENGPHQSTMMTNSYSQQIPMNGNQWSAPPAPPSPSSSSSSSSLSSSSSSYGDNSNDRTPSSTNNAVWSSPLQTNNYYYDKGDRSNLDSSRSEGLDYYQSNFQSRSSSSSSSSPISSIQRQSSIDRQQTMPSPAYIGPSSKTSSSSHSHYPN